MLVSNINILLEKIKNAIYGIDVRNAIHDAIKQTYIDAIDANNSSMEVSNARGKYNTLGERLDANEGIKKLELKEIEGGNIALNLENNIYYKCISEISDLTISLLNSDINFNSKLYFTANSDFTIENNIKFTGDNTDSGKLLAKKGFTYLIDFIYPNIGLVYSVNENEGDDSDEPAIDDELHDFIEGSELVAIAKTYFDARDKYMRYGQTNICSNSGNTSWEDATTTGADSPDGRYRKLDCSALSQLSTAGITFNEVFKDKTTYNNRDLSARVEDYAWAIRLPRTAAEQCKYIEQIGWALPSDKWHTNEAQWGGLKAGDLIFFGNSDNGRYKGVYHVAIYYGEYTSSTGENKLCVIDCSSNSGISRHSDDITKGVRIIQFNKMDISNIVTVARNQNGATS